MCVYVPKELSNLLAIALPLVLTHIVLKSSEDEHQINSIIISNNNTVDGITCQSLLEFMYMQIKHGLSYTH